MKQELPLSANSLNSEIAFGLASPMSMESERGLLRTGWRIRVVRRMMNDDKMLITTGEQIKYWSQHSSLACNSRLAATFLTSINYFF